MGADMLRKLNGEARDAAGAALNEDRLAALELERVLDRDDRGEADERQRGGIDVRECGRFLGDDGRADRDLFAIGALTPGIEHAEHVVADLYVSNPVPHRRDRAGKIPAEHKGEFHLRRIEARTHAPISAVDARGLYVDHDFACRRRGIGQVAILQHFGTAEFFDEGRFHGSCPVLSLLRRVIATVL